MIKREENDKEEKNEKKEEGEKRGVKRRTYRGR